MGRVGMLEIAIRQHRLGLRGHQADQAAIRSSAHGGVQIDDLDFREGGEALQHFAGRIGFESFLAALDELDDLAVEQVDAGENHGAFRTGMPPRSRYSLRSAMRMAP